MSRLQWWWYRLRGKPLSCSVQIFQTCSWNNDTFSDKPFWVVVGDGKTRNFGVTEIWTKNWYERWVQIR